MTKRTMSTNRGRVWGKRMILPLGPGFFSVPQEVRRPSYQTCSCFVSRVRVEPTVKQNTEYSFVGPGLYYMRFDYFS